MAALRKGSATDPGRRVHHGGELGDHGMTESEPRDPAMAAPSTPEALRLNRVGDGACSAEVRITPEMVEAGVEEAALYGPEDFEVMVHSVFVAMLRRMLPNLDLTVRE